VQSIKIHNVLSIVLTMTRFSAQHAGNQNIGTYKFLRISNLSK
jgi:hypothetical protein